MSTLEALQVENYRQIFTRMPIACFILDPKLLIINANLKAAQLLGVNQADLIGTSLGQRLNEAHRDNLQLLLAASNVCSHTLELELLGAASLRLDASIERLEPASDCSLLTVAVAVRDKLHDLNQPLAAIANYAVSGIYNLDKRQLSVAQTRNLLEQIGAQAQRAAEIARSFRSLPRD